ncbi:MAG TPA: inositol monophosphatase [Gammaproteobacteria bacterium]|nr:inositol monophosphatase [Gammaproteobacteria bacterium]
MHPMLNTATKAARAAGAIILRNIDRVDTLTIKTKSRNDFVSEVDRMAENEIISILKTAYPDHGFLGEETGTHDIDAAYQWVIDPLDGTTNFLYGIPHYAVSIALRHNNHFEQAVVYDPFKDELFTASRGGGAQLNGRKIRVSSARSLEGALLGTGIPFREDQDLDLYLQTLRVLVPGTAGIRRAGSAALDMAYVAAGRLDGFWEFGMRKWDIAAGILLVQEAGGLVGDLYGGLNHYENGDIICGGPKVYKGMLERLRNISELRDH